MLHELRSGHGGGERSRLVARVVLNGMVEPFPAKCMHSPPSNGLVKPKDNADAAIGSSSSRPTRRRSARVRSVRPDRPKRGYRLCRLDVRVV